MGTSFGALMYVSDDDVYDLDLERAVHDQDLAVNARCCGMG